jgi:hypothetical protein
MNQSPKVKIVVFVPETHAEAVRAAMAQAGAGRIGDYAACSFSSRGTGRFKPEAGAHPAIGAVGKPEAVDEERIEATCERKIMRDVVAAIKSVHPYEEVALDIYPLENI